MKNLFYNKIKYIKTMQKISFFIVKYFLDQKSTIFYLFIELIYIAVNLNHLDFMKGENFKKFPT